MDGVSVVPEPFNEPVRAYPPGGADRDRLKQRLAELAAGVGELPMTINGHQRMGGGPTLDVRAPHRHRTVLGRLAEATDADVAAAVDAALQAAPMWSALSFDDRAAVFLKAADLLTGPWRDTLNAATMHGQSKTVHQAEIDAVCELADFWRFNVAYAQRILSEQPASSAGTWNRTDHRPLEGFVLAITPFNFTAIAGNLPTAPALMGNTVVWKPSPTQQLAAHFTMRLLEAAGLPPGVINLVTGSGAAVSSVALTHPALAGVHFTGSTATFQHLWRTVGSRIDSYAGYPRLVGETGGKDFVVAHPSADPAALRTALIRGAFEYQGQKCSAASRAYLPAGLWRTISSDFLAEVRSLPMGDVSDFRNFLGAVIDRRSFDRLRGVLSRVCADSTISLEVGGGCDDSEGYFVQPTVLVGQDAGHEVFTTEYFGPILAIFVYEEAAFEATLTRVARDTPYGLTGSVFASDRRVLAQAAASLRYAAGNLYLNDKPTGAVVGQQPFGGARASGTNDKAGSPANLLRWVSPRVVKEAFVPAEDYRYPHMA
ncbi:MAG: L-glutamate gamma-semialdehyde dehydrogenase [Mycobacteriales bacterium]